MIIQPIEKKDKHGRTIVMRGPKESDAEKLLNYMRITTSETPFLIRDPDEVIMTVEQEKEFLRERIASDKELLLLAEMDGKHVGSASLMANGPYRRYAHRCSLAIALYEKYWGAGIGEMMLEVLLSEAKKLGYEQAELEVVTTNHRAIALYKKLGFEKYGTLPNNMKLADGSYADADWMMKKL